MKYNKPKILKVGDDREFCIQEKDKPSQILFGVVIKINKETESADFEKVWNTGQVRKGKKVLTYTGQIYKNVTAIRGGVHESTWDIK